VWALQPKTWSCETSGLVPVYNLEGVVVMEQEGETLWSKVA